MSQPIVSQPTTAIAAIPLITPSLATDALAYQKAVAWLDAHRGDAIPRRMQWSECPTHEWPDDANRPLQFWLMTAHTQAGMFAITVALYHNDVYTVCGGMAEARA